MTNGKNILEYYELNAERLHNDFLAFKGLDSEFVDFITLDYSEGRE